MSKEKIEIEVPEGYTAKFNQETMKIELVKKDTKPKTWKECYDNYIDEEPTIWTPILVSKEEAEAFRALSQLRQLYKVWIKDWVPDYSHSSYGTFGIRRYNKEQEFRILDVGTSGLLIFPTKEMAEEFLDCFRDLIETAKILL